MIDIAKLEEVGRKTFTTPKVARIAGLPIRKVLSYHERGYIRASIQEASGHGSKRLYSFADVVKIKAIQVFQELGLSVDMLRAISKRWDDGAGFSRNKRGSVIFSYMKSGVPFSSQSISDFIEEDLEGEPMVSLNVTAVDLALRIKIMEEGP